MIKRLKNTFLLYSDGMGIISAIIGGAWLVGMIIVALILNFAKNLPNSYFNAGTVFALVIGGFYVLITDFMFFAINFNIAVSMGISRKRFLINGSIVLFVQHLIYIALLFVLSKLEMLLAALFYPNLDRVKDIMNIDGIMLLQMVGGVLALIAVSIFIGALLQRFGKTAFWIMWGIYMFFAIGGVGLTSMSKTNGGLINSVVHTVGNILKNTTFAGWLTIIAVLCSILAGVGALIFRKAPVK